MTARHATRLRAPSTFRLASESPPDVFQYEKTDESCYYRRWQIGPKGNAKERRMRADERDDGQ